MDPTAPDVTLGHAVPLKIVRQFQDWGHKAVLIIGDYTARVGDPSGRNKTRPMLTGEEIDRNAKTYVAQVGKILLTDPEHLEIRYNGEWLGKMNLVDIIKLAAAQDRRAGAQREDFAKRYAEGVDIRLHEIIYPLLQGWDSVHDRRRRRDGRQRPALQQPRRPRVSEGGGRRSGRSSSSRRCWSAPTGMKKMSKSQGQLHRRDRPAQRPGRHVRQDHVPAGRADGELLQLLTDVPMDEFSAQIATQPARREDRAGEAHHHLAAQHEAADAAEAEFVKQFIEEGSPRRDARVRRRRRPAQARAADREGGTGVVATAKRSARSRGAVSLDGEKVRDVQGSHDRQADGPEARPEIRAKPAEGVKGG